ncbi:MAG: bifunctional YncE family protein/alkaline phosphatase family protein [Armatimonadetes bacterium]|nr:bifunctional YncE family protein/alkaline phosphatase family protein [Armatimonadota bacterium]
MTTRLGQLTAVLAATMAIGMAAALPMDQRTAGRRDDATGISAANWLIAPAGQLLDVGEMPQHVLLSPDGKRLAVANVGFGVQSVMLIDTATRKIVQRAEFQTPKAIFRGMAFSADGTALYVSGGPSDVIRVVKVLPDGGINVTVPEIPLRRMASAPPVENPETFAGKVTLPDPAGKGVVLYPGGLAVSPDGTRLWVTEIMGGALAIVDPAAGSVERRIPVGGNPYEIVFDGARQQAFVTLWGAGKVAVIDLAAGRGNKQIAVDLHPTGMALDAAAHRLYVACTNSDTVVILDTMTLDVVGRVRLQPYPGAPLGGAPTALALGERGETLYVACSGENAVASLALNAERTGGEVTGRLPAGWYPMGLARGADGTLWVASGRGLGSTQNGLPRRRYIPGTMAGLLQAIPPTSAQQWRAGLRTVLANNNQLLGTEPRTRQATTGSPIPSRVGGASPIRYCVYIIKENRTYDQVFGDLPQGNGEPKLVMFGREVTPNQHRLAEQYALLDNFYCDGTVSVDGHQWAKAASAADGTERGWGSSYSQRGPGLPGPLTQPATPWLWDQATAAGVTSKVYQGGIDPGKDLTRVATVLGDLATWEQTGEMPRLVVMHLPNNHTLGTRKGAPTPKAMVAENDLAVGRLVEGLSHSRFWPQMAVFIVEDDAQDGPDHVDAHRSPCLVIGPHVQRGKVESTFYDQLSVLRTMELILGMQPLGQFDAAALPMWTLFSPQAKPEPYQCVVPAQPVDEKNADGAFGQAWCDAQDFAEVDEQPWPEFNRILWASVKGADAPLPEIRNTRMAMAVKVAGEDEDDD